MPLGRRSAILAPFGYRPSEDGSSVSALRAISPFFWGGAPLALDATNTAICAAIHEPAASALGSRLSRGSLVDVHRTSPRL
jgi:hypothetical protein